MGVAGFAPAFLAVRWMSHLRLRTLGLTDRRDPEWIYYSELFLSLRVRVNFADNLFNLNQETDRQTEDYK